MALQELSALGVDNLITFDAHDARVQNAIPNHGFENIQPAYQMIKALVKNVPDLKIDNDHLMIISPDEGGMSRCIYYSTVLGIDLGAPAFASVFVRPVADLQAADDNHHAAFCEILTDGLRCASPCHAVNPVGLLLAALAFEIPVNSQGE